MMLMSEGLGLDADESVESDDKPGMTKMRKVIRPDADWRAQALEASSSQARMQCTRWACSLTCRVNRLESFSLLPSKVPWSCTDRLVTWSARLHRTTYTILLLSLSHLLVRINPQLVL